MIEADLRLRKNGEILCERDEHDRLRDKIAEILEFLLIHKGFKQDSVVCGQKMWADATNFSFRSPDSLKINPQFPGDDHGLITLVWVEEKAVKVGGDSFT